MAYSYLLLLHLSGCFKLGPCDVFASNLGGGGSLYVYSWLGVDPIVNGLILFMGLVLCRQEMLETHFRFITR